MVSQNGEFLPDIIDFATFYDFFVGLLEMFSPCGTFFFPFYSNKWLIYAEFVVFVKLKKN